MIIDLADRLHEGIDDDGPAKFKTVLFQGFGQGLAFFCLRWDLGSIRPLIDQRMPARCIPNEIGKINAAFRHGQIGAGIADGCFNLGL